MRCKYEPIPCYVGTSRYVEENCQENDNELLGFGH